MILARYVAENYVEVMEALLDLSNKEKVACLDKYFPKNILLLHYKPQIQGPMGFSTYLNS